MTDLSLRLAALILLGVALCGESGPGTELTAEGGRVTSLLGSQPWGPLHQTGLSRSPPRWAERGAVPR